MLSLRCWPTQRKSFQITEIGCDSVDVGFGQVMRDWLHDGGIVRLGFVLTSFFLPVCQFPVDVVMELSCQPRKCVSAFGVRSVTGSAWRNLRTGNAIFIDFLPFGHELLWSSSQLLVI